MAGNQILVIAGSAREGALSVKLATVAAASLRAAGAEVTPLDLRALALPLYDGDLEAANGVPDGVTSSSASCASSASRSVRAPSGTPLAASRSPS